MQVTTVDAFTENVNRLPTEPHYAGKCALRGAALFLFAAFAIGGMQIVVIGAPLTALTALILSALAIAYALIGFACGAYWSLRAPVQRLREIHDALERIAQDDDTPTR